MEDQFETKREWQQGYSAGFNLPLDNALDIARVSAGSELENNKYYNRGLLEGRLDKLAQLAYKKESQ